MAHHHKSYYEREDGYVYSNEELDAYNVPSHRRNRCVNFYIPLKKCREVKYPNNYLKSTAQFINAGLDQWGGDCYKELQDYKDCEHTYEKLALAAPVRNLYHNAPLAARLEGISPEFQKKMGVSPLLY